MNVQTVHPSRMNVEWGLRGRYHECIQQVLVYCKLTFLIYTSVLLTTQRLRSPIEPTMVTLLVGPLESTIVCHRSLLGYYSNYFQASLFGGFSEAGASELRLKEEIDGHIQSFVCWAYTGKVVPAFADQYTNYRRRMFELWVLGDRLVAPKFCNDVMMTILTDFDMNGPLISAAAARFVYDSTAKGSKLRLLLRDTIASGGPFATVSEYDEEEQNKWEELIEEGGELVSSICRAGGFSNKAEESMQPWSKENPLKYLKECNGQLRRIGWPQFQVQCKTCSYLHCFFRFWDGRFRDFMKKFVALAWWWDFHSGWLLLLLGLGMLYTRVGKS